MSDKKNFLKGAAILGGAGIIIKILGAFFRIPLGNMLGDEGMSYYQTAYPIYLWLMVVSTAGLPTAIAKMISERNALEDYEGIQKIFKVSFYLMTSLGILTSGILYLGSEKIVLLSGNDLEALYAVKFMAPALLFVSMMSVYRGFFQGLQDLKPYALSQIIEQIFRVLLGLGLAYAFINKGVGLAAGGATIGAVFGAFVGLIFMTFYYLRNKNNIYEGKISKNPQNETTKEILKKLWIIAIPVTIGASVVPAMSIADLFLIMPRLKEAGLIEEANNLYGQLSGYARTLTNLPGVIIAAFQISLVPAISRLKIVDKAELKTTIQTALRIAVIIGLPSSIGLVVMSKEIMSLLYPAQPEIIDSIAGILSVLGWGVLFLSIFQITTGILQGLDKQKLPARNLFVGAIIKIILTYVLVAIPSINIYGAAFSTVIAYLIGAVLNVFAVVKYGDVKLNYMQVFIKPAIIVSIMGIVAKASYYGIALIISPKLATVIAISLAALVYGVLLLLFRVIDENDLELIPGGKKISRVLNKIS